jgi:hypothetical protein
MNPDNKRMSILQQKYRVPHFDAKAEADAYFTDLPATILLTSFYWDNLHLFGLAPRMIKAGGLQLDVSDGEQQAGGNRS